MNEEDQQPPWQFERTKCACSKCVQCCKRQPGPLAPRDFKRIAAFLGEDEITARQHFWASPGSIVKDWQGNVMRIGTITPRFDRRKGRCVFLGDDDRCKIHEVAPFGCAYFDTHMNEIEAQARSSWLAGQQQRSEEYQDLRAQLPYALHHKPLRYSLGGES